MGGLRSDALPSIAALASLALGGQTYHALKIGQLSVLLDVRIEHTGTG